MAHAWRFVDKMDGMDGMDIPEMPSLSHRRQRAGTALFRKDTGPARRPGPVSLLSALLGSVLNCLAAFFYVLPYAALPRTKITRLLPRGGHIPERPVTVERFVLCSGKRTALEKSMRKIRPSSALQRPDDEGPTTRHGVLCLHAETSPE